MKVDVYWNIKKKLFSVRSREKGEHYGRVLFHRTRLILRSPKFVVSEAGRQKVLREKQKNIHAVVRGELTAPAEFKETFSKLPLERARRVTYNPYINATFVFSDTKDAVYHGDTAILFEDKSKPQLLLM